MIMIETKDGDRIYVTTADLRAMQGLLSMAPFLSSPVMAPSHIVYGYAKEGPLSSDDSHKVTMCIWNMLSDTTITFDDLVATIKGYVARGYDLDAPIRDQENEEEMKDFPSLSLLAIAIQRERDDLATWLIEQGVNLEYEMMPVIQYHGPYHRCTALTWAIYFNRPDIAKLLLEKGVKRPKRVSMNCEVMFSAAMFKVLYTNGVTLGSFTRTVWQCSGFASDVLIDTLIEVDAPSELFGCDLLTHLPCERLEKHFRDQSARYDEAKTTLQDVFLDRDSASLMLDFLAVRSSVR